MSYEQWVLDVTSPIDGPYCFCPIEGENVIVGMNVIGHFPPRGGRVVGVFSEHGQEPVGAAWSEWKLVLERLQKIGA